MDDDDDDALQGVPLDLSASLDNDASPPATISAPPCEPPLVLAGKVMQRPTPIRPRLQQASARPGGFQPLQPCHRSFVVLTKASVGFIPSYGERLNPVMGLDCKEAFDYTLGPNKDGSSHLGQNQMPCLPSFYSDAMKYIEQNCVIAGEVLHSICESLHLKPDEFDHHFKNPLAIQRLIRYPPQKMEEKDSIGAGAHVDFGAVTILKQDSDG